MLGHTLRSSHAAVKLTWRGPATVSIIVAALQSPAVKAPREIKRRLDAIARGCRGSSEPRPQGCAGGLHQVRLLHGLAAAFWELQ